MKAEDAITVLDGYVDEPAMLGVPPYVSPLARYVYGAAKEAGKAVKYLTIDQYRRGERIDGDGLLVVIKGAIVPGKYLRGMPISDREAANLDASHAGVKVVGGAGVRFSKDESQLGGYNYCVSKDLDAFVYDLLEGKGPKDRWRTPDEWRRWAVSGAELVRFHPDYPQPLIAEVDTSRGCVRYFCGGCSFCSETSYGEPYFREPEEIVEEVRALDSHGVTNFRLGGQACIFSYMSEGVGETETPKPNPEALEALLAGIREAAPGLRVLHLDNANPAVIAENPLESEKAAEAIVRHCTPGNVVAFGMESADPEVISANNLNATPEQVMLAVRLVNSVGGCVGPNGMPALLPGINLLSGLDGESKSTYKLNYQFLKQVLDDGMMLRRINIRQVAPHVRGFDTRKHYGEFRRFKEKVRSDIDLPMLKRVAAEGTVLGDVFIEVQIGGSTFGRQVGSYPILCEFPYKAEVDRYTDALIVGHGPKSLRCVETPLDVNRAPMGALEALPGIGRKRATRIMAGRPYSDAEQLKKSMDDGNVIDKIASHILF